jgi:hypothetical protein
MTVGVHRRQVAAGLPGQTGQTPRVDLDISPVGKHVRLAQKPERDFECSHPHHHQVRRDTASGCDARRAASRQMQAAGVALAAGSRAAGGAARDGARAGLAPGPRPAGGLVFLVRAGHRARLIVGPSHGQRQVPVALAGAVACGAAIGHWRILGLDREAATLAVGLVRWPACSGIARLKA